MIDRGDAAFMAGDRKELEIVYEDDEVVGVVKPAGLPTANAAAGAHSVYTALRNRPPGGRFVGIVSRLDAAVSGIVVVAKTSGAAAALAEQFRRRSIEKGYLAVVERRFPAPVGTWVDWHDMVLRRPNERRSELVRRPGGGAVTQSIHPEDEDGEADSDGGATGRPLPASARARVLRRAGEVSLVELRPATGRRHQLRLQLSARGCPIVGDRLYGARLPLGDGIALHARRLRFAHPRTAAIVELEAPLPAIWQRRFPALFAGEGDPGV
jgi:23S rRNA pseudouridine1911/1915/1917 synthase